MARKSTRTATRAAGKTPRKNTTTVASRPILENPHLDPDFAKRLEELPRAKLDELLDRRSSTLLISQRFSLPIIEWLINGQIGSGRTTVLAHAFIRTAIRRAPQVVYPVDHSQFMHGQTYEAKKTILRVIDRVLHQQYADFDFIFKQTELSIQCVGRHYPTGARRVPLGDGRWRAER